MKNTKEYWTVRDENGWAVECGKNTTQISCHDSQYEAWKKTRRLARGEGVDAVLFGNDGRVKTRANYRQKLKD